MTNNNEYAKNIEGVIVHISKIARGRKGYYCIGCTEEIEARKGEIKEHYFAHVPKNLSGFIRKCTYSDEQYRHKVAKEILQRLKQIRVPPLYKFPPNGVNGNPNRLQKGRIITAASVHNELQFYEDEEGQIKYGRGINFLPENKRHLLVQPDVTFFNELEEPILFIEIVATHSVDAEKLAKLKKIGIDTIEVKIPKGSPEDIEEVFSRITRTKWIFSYERETTSYIFLSKGNQEGVSPTDEFERKLSEAEESFKCRSAQIKSLIRGIRKNLAGKQYKAIKRSLRAEILQVEGNTEAGNRKLSELQREANEEIARSIRRKRELLEAETRVFELEEKQFGERQRSLEERYNRKTEKLEQEEIEYQKSFDREIEKFEGRIKTLRNSPGTIRDGIGVMEYSKESYTRLIEERGRNIEEGKTRIDELRSSFENEEARIAKRRSTILERHRANEKQISDEFRKKQDELESEIRETAERIRTEDEQYRGRVSEAIKNRVISGNERITRGIKETISQQRLFVSIRERQSRIKSFELFKELLDSQDFKNWPEL